MCTGAVAREKPGRPTGPAELEPGDILIGTNTTEEFRKVIAALAEIPGINPIWWLAAKRYLAGETKTVETAEPCELFPRAACPPNC